MLNKLIQKNLRSHDCSILENTDGRALVDCNEFRLSKVKGLPWRILLPYPSIAPISRRFDPPIPARKISVGFWETPARWGKVKDLKVTDEVFIDIDEENIHDGSNTAIDGILDRIKKLKTIQNESNVKNIDFKKTIEESVGSIAQAISTHLENTYESRGNTPVACEPEHLVTNRWMPTRGSEYRYTLNIICAVPHLSEAIQEKITDFGKWEIVRTRKMDFVRSIFPVKEAEMYLNEIVFHDENYAKTPYISMIFDPKLLKSPDAVPKIRGILHDNK